MHIIIIKQNFEKTLYTLDKLATCRRENIFSKIEKIQKKNTLNP